MSSPTPQQSPLERTKAEMSQLDQKIERDFRKVDMAMAIGRNMFDENEARINSLRSTFQEYQKSATAHVENSLKLSDTRIHDLEDSLRVEKRRTVTLNGELTTQKVNNDLTDIQLKKTKSELEDANRRVEVLETELETATQNFDELENDFGRVAGSKMELEDRLSAAEQRETELRAELELGGRQNAEFQERLNAVERQCVDLQADLKTARQQASTAEEELKSFEIHYNQIKAMMTDFSSPSTQKQAEPPLVSPLSFTPQDSVEEGHNEPQRQDHTLETSGLDSHTSTTTSDKRPEMLHCANVLHELMDSKNYKYNRFFIKPVDSAIFASLGTKLGPVNLGTMKDKLAKGAYTSSTSFKTDFGLMIADCKRLNPTTKLAHFAAEQLSKAFEQAFSAQPNSSHQSLDIANSTKEASNRKRKAETNTGASSDGGRTQKRRSLAPLDQDTEQGQPAIPGTGGGPTTVLPSLSPSKHNIQAPEQTNAYYVESRITAAPAFEFDAHLSTVAELVSIIRSPSTIHGDWKSMIPDKQVFAYTAQTPVGDRISDLVRGLSSDVIILRLMPATKAAKPDFDLIFKHFIGKRRFGTVSHVGIKNVEEIYLVPLSREHCYPDFFSTLDFHLLPPSQTEDVLLMAIVFKVHKTKQAQVRTAWDNRMMAIRNHDNDGLVSMRDVLSRNPLHIFSGRRTLVSSADRHLAMLKPFPRSKKIPGPELHAYGHAILLLSCREWDLSSRPNVDGVAAPEWVFFLASVVLNDVPKSILVVDIQKKNRPLWLIGPGASDRMGFTLTLLANKFPGSLKEWEDTIPEMGGIPNREGEKCIKNVGLQVERCKRPE